MNLVWILGAAAVLGWFVIEKRRRRTHPVSGGLHPDISLPHEAEYELYGNAFSHCSRKTRIVFAELGLPFRHRHIDLVETGGYETISPEYLKVNPAGLVPTLVHNGHPVYESDEILQYAAACAGMEAPQLTPADPTEETEMHRWIARANLPSGDPLKHMDSSAGACMAAMTLPLFATAIRYIPLRRILPGFLFHPNKERPAFFTLAKALGFKRLLLIPPLRNTLCEARHKMEGHLMAFAVQLETSGGPWLLGEQYTLADVSWSCILLRLDETGWLPYFVDDLGMGALSAYYDRVRARQSWQTAIATIPHPVIELASADLRAAMADGAVRRVLFAPAAHRQGAGSCVH